MRADLFAPASPDVLARWEKFGSWPDRTYFPNVIGLELEEVRTDYCRMRLPYRVEHEQPAGVVHGGAIASLVDTVVVPAVGQAYDAGTAFMTVSMTINYIGAVDKTDLVAEGWVSRRGRSTVFCQVEAFTLAGSDERLAAQASLVYAVRPPR